jgi:hypothetical protein
MPLQTLDNHGQRQHIHIRRRQLNCQWQAVALPHQLDEKRSLLLRPRCPKGSANSLRRPPKRLTNHAKVDGLAGAGAASRPVFTAATGLYSRPSALGRGNSATSIFGIYKPKSEGSWPEKGSSPWFTAISTAIPIRACTGL